MRKALVLLCFLSACSGDVLPPKPPPLQLLYDKQWNLKTSVKGGVTAAHQGEWFRLTNENTPSYCGPVWRDHMGNEWLAVVDPYSIAIVYPYQEYRIGLLKKDSLVLESLSGNTFRFSTR